MHPVVNIAYFIVAILLTICFLHPVIIFISFVFATLYLMYNKVNLHIVSFLIMLICVILINPLVNHQGVTTLFYMFSGNPITLESILYGVFAGFMIISVILWFNCYMVIVTSDKFIYLFSKISKKLSLMFSMILRFVPLLVGRLKECYNYQKLVTKNKLKVVTNAFYMTSSWALENAIITSKSLKARGYELKHRSSFNMYKFSTRDKVMLLVIILLFCVLCFFYVNEMLYIRYFPSIVINTQVIGILASVLLLSLPFLVNLYYFLMYKFGGNKWSSIR